MKKSLILALALVAPAMAGDEKAAPIVDIPPAPPAASAWGIELGYNMTWPMSDVLDYYHDVNGYGFDVTAFYNLNDNWSVNLRFSWAKGSDVTGYSWADEGYALAEIGKLSIKNWSIAPGVRYTAPITGKLSWFAGANVGVGMVDVEEVFAWAVATENEYYADGDEWSHDEFGMYYSVEAGLRYNVTDSCYVFGSAMFTGTLLECDLDKQFSVGIRAGVGFEF